MRIEDIGYFIKTVNEGSINRSAEMMHLTHQNLGKIIRGIEDELQLRLLNRGNKGISLTKDGRYAYERFMEIEGIYEELLSYAHAANQKAGQESGAVHIYMAANMLAAPFAQTIMQVRERFPGVDLRLVECTQEEAIRQTLEEGDCYTNLILPETVRRPELRDAGLELLLDRSVSMVVYLPVGLSDRLQGRGMDIHDLTDLPLVMYSAGDLGEDMVYKEVCRYVMPNVRYHTNNAVIFNSLVRTGDYAGIGLLYDPINPLTDNILKGSVFTEMHFLRVPVLVKGKPLRMHTVWCCRQGQPVSDTGKYLLSIL